MSKRWNPYVAGALTGLVMLLSVVVSQKYFGASTSFVRVAGMIENVVTPELVAQNEYYMKKTPKVDWQVMFVAGIFLGALGAALVSRTWRCQLVPDIWRERFGDTPVKRSLAAFVGGFILIFGARFAGGCPSGHGLSGVMQLAPGSIISTACFFLGGIIVANVLYGKGVRS